MNTFKRKPCTYCCEVTESAKEVAPEMKNTFACGDCEDTQVRPHQDSQFSDDL